MKNPILLFVLKCCTIVYVIAFADVERFTIAPVSTMEVKNNEKRSLKEVTLNSKNTDHPDDKLYFPRL